MNKIYDSVIDLCMDLEKNGMGYTGDQLARILAYSVTIGQLPAKQRAVFDAMSNVFRSSVDISKESGVPTSSIGMAIEEMKKKGIKIRSKKEGMYKFYRVVELDV